VTDPVLRDVAPSFDPKGKYLYFLGYRTFDPVDDSMQFDYNFPRGVRPYAIPLRRDMRSPFISQPKLLLEKEEAKKRRQTSEEGELEVEKGRGAEERRENEEDAKKADRLVIDLEDITSRALPFPVKEGCFSKVRGIKGKALFLVFPVQGMLASHEAKGWIESYDFETQRSERLIDSVDDFDLSRDSKTLIYASRHRLRILKAGDKPPRDNGDHSGREGGWLDLDRVKVSVQPAAEWKQMFAEAWAVQHEQFWTEDMSGVDWNAAYAQYAPLIERVGSRSELSDLFRELYGELGTSHAYEIGGEYRKGRYYRQGFLGLDWTYDEMAQRYRIARIVRGDPSDSKATSPLTSPGLDVAEGDAVIAVNGQRVGPNRSPQELLVNQANQEVQLTIESAESGEVHDVIVTALTEEYTARYREWVDCNCRKVHECSQGRVGYIHIPDMGPEGYAEFHRAYLTEYDYPALLIDVRWNSGGYVSGLLLEKLARRRLGYKFSRWRQPTPYPRESPRGPMVALTNEHACSDGDIFSHNFKLMGLGPLIGMRTWGGVIGYTHRYRLVDGTHITQPENANWFKDVGWNLENYGTDPDIEVDIAPQDYASGRDPQLERAIAEAMRIADEYPALEPKPGEKPRKGRL
jgi:tricorn protease